MESNTDTKLNHNLLFERNIIKYIINYLKVNQLKNALTLIHEYVENESIVKAVHDYLLGLNCKYPELKINNILKECGIYNTFILRLDFEMYESSTEYSKCPCGSLVCVNWKYFTRNKGNIWTVAPMEFFTNEYFQKGFMEKIA